MFKYLTSRIVGYLTANPAFVKWLREEIVLTLQAYDKAAAQLYMGKIPGLSSSSNTPSEVPRTIGFHV
jgi:hypothetical protein